jgi:hypothetical protein
MAYPSVIKFEKMLEVGISPQAVLNSMMLDKHMTLEILHQFFSDRNLLNQVSIPTNLPAPIPIKKANYELMIRVGIPSAAVSLRREFDSH